MSAELRKLINERISLNSGGFSSPEVNALLKALEAIVDELEDLDDRVTTLEP